MNREELINKFQQIKNFYGDIPLGQLQYQIEKRFSTAEKNTLFKKTLSQYINQLHKLQSWKQLSRKNQ